MIENNVFNWNWSHVKVSFQLFVQVDGECRLVKFLWGDQKYCGQTRPFVLEVNYLWLTLMCNWNLWIDMLHPLVLHMLHYPRRWWLDWWGCWGRFELSITCGDFEAKQLLEWTREKQSALSGWWRLLSPFVDIFPRYGYIIVKDNVPNLGLAYGDIIFIAGIRITDNFWGTSLDIVKSHVFSATKICENMLDSTPMPYGRFLTVSCRDTHNKKNIKSCENCKV